MYGERVAQTTSPRSPDVFWRDTWAITGSVSLVVLPRVLVFGAFSSLVLLVRGKMGGLTLEVGPVELAGGALVLLMVLRTNAGYDRWWEGRKLWGGIVNQSRNLAISALTFAANADDDWRDRCVRWVAAFPHAAKRSLRGEREIPEIAALVGEAAAARVAASEHMPSAVARELATLLVEATERHGMSQFAFMQCDRERTTLIDHLGGCERILKTPLPLVYVIKVRRFVVLYLAALPFALVDKVGWVTPMLTMLVAYPVLGLDQIAVELENPFVTSRKNHLPLDGICETIEANVLALVSSPMRPLSSTVPPRKLTEP